MSLIKCPECGKDVSSNASSCPNCGHPLSAVVDFQLSLVSGHKVDVKNGTLSVFDDHGICISTDSISNYTLQFYKMQAPAVGDIYLEVIFSHPSLVSPITLKQYFLGSQKSADYPPHIFQAFYLAQPKGLCGNYRHFPAKRF